MCFNCVIFEHLKCLPLLRGLPHTGQSQISSFNAFFGAAASCFLRIDFLRYSTLGLMVFSHDQQKVKSPCIEVQSDSFACCMME